MTVKLSEPKCPKAVLILWEDAKSFSGWNAPEEFSIELCLALGFVLKEDANFIAVSSVVDSTASESNGTVTIPKGMIQALIYLPNEMLDELLQSCVSPTDA